MAVAAATVEASEQRRRGISTTSDHSGLSPQRDILEMALAEEGIKDSIQMRFAKNSRERAETHWHRLADEDEEDDFGWDTDDRLLPHHSKSGDSQMAGSIGRCRHNLRMMLDHPESSNAAYALQMMVMSVIVLSTISAVFETVPSLHQEYASFFSASECVFTMLFTVEVLCRMVVSKSCRGYVCSISNQIDVIATMPWYVERIMVHTAPASDHSHLEKMAGSLRTLRMVRLARMVRLLRVLRLAKVARHSEVISIVLESLVESATGVVVLMSFVSMWALVCATVVYAAEIDAPDTDFVSIPAALWWSMATISTVGYGDMVPHTSLGKLVGGVSMLGGILITSISVAVITTSFTEHYQQRVRVHEVSKFKELARRHSMLENANANGEVTPDSSTVTRSRQPDVLASWQELEEEVQKHLVRLEAEILYRPLRTRPSDTHVALEMLKAEAQGHSLRNSPPRTPGTDVRARASPLEVQNVAPRARPKTFSIAIQTDLARPEDRILPERGEQRAPVAAVAAVAPGSAGKTKTESPRDAGLDIEHVRDSMQVLLHNGARSPSATAQRRPSLERQGSDVDEVIPHAESTAPSVPAAVAKTGDGSQESPQALQLAPRHSSEIRTGDGSQESPQALQLAPRHSSEIRLPPGAVTSRTEAQHAKPAKPLEVGMTPSTSSASLAQTALPSQQLFESYSSSSVQASQLSTELTAEPAIFELPADPAIFATRPSSKGQKNSKVAVERRSATDQTDMSVRRRTPLDDMDLSPRENRLGDENRPQTGETLTSKSPTSKRLLHLSRGDGDFELSNQAVQAELQEVRADPELETKMSGKQLASSLGRKDAGAPQKAAQEAAEAVKAAMKSKGLEENEAHELAALCAGVAASEAAAQSGYSPQDATNFAGTEALAAAKASGFPDDLSLQCTSQALGAVIGRAAAESKWTPSRAASCAADVVRRFVDVNDISYDNLVSMTAMSAHEAAETVALVQKLRPEEAAMVGAEAASRITTEVVTKILRQHADYAVQQAGAKQTVQHTLAVHEPSTPSGRPEVSASSSRHSSRGPNSHERAPLPRLPPALPGQAPETAPVPAGPEVAPSRSFVRPQVTRRLSISELTLPAMAPSTSRRPSQMQPLLGDGTVGPPSPSSPQPNEQYPDASRIMSYGSGRTTEVDRRASTYLQQMQERRASLSLRRMEPPEPPAQSRSNAPAGAKPKLQGWQRVREVNDRGRAEKRVRTPSRLTPRNAQIDIGEISSPEAPTERRRSFVEHMQAQAQQKVQRPAPVAPVAPAQPPSLSQAAGRVMRLGMAVGNKVKRDGPELALDAAFVLQEAVKQRQGKLRKPERARAPDLRIDAARPEEVLLNSQRRSSQRYQPEARQPTEPFAPDVDGLFVAAGTRSEALAAGDATPSVRDARPVSKTASTSFQRQAPGLEGKTFNGLASPGSTARSMEPDPGNVADVLSVSQLSSSKSFYKSQSREIFRPNEQDALSRAPDAEDPDTDQLEDLEMVHRTSSRVLPQLSSLAPSVVPVGPRKSECEADLLVQRICSSLDGKFGSVDAAFLSMSAKLQRVEAPTAEGAESTEDKEDRKLVQLRSCLVESGVGFKDATVLLQAMRSGLAGAMPTLQHVANSLRPGQLPQEAIELAKKKGAFSLSGSDDPNINLESIRGFSNLDARSILQRPGREGREGLEGRDGRAPPSAAGTRSGSPNRTRSHSNSPSRSKSKGASVAGHE